MHVPPKNSRNKSILASKVTALVNLAKDTTFGLKTIPVTVRFFETVWKEVKNMAKETGHSNNNMVNILVRDRLESLKRPRFTPYTIIGTTKVVLFDRAQDTLVVVTLEEDLDELIHVLCEAHVGAESCEHIEFVKKIPTVRAWIKEAQDEYRRGGGQPSPK